MFASEATSRIQRLTEHETAFMSPSPFDAISEAPIRAVARCGTESRFHAALYRDSMLLSGKIGREMQYGKEKAQKNCDAGFESRKSLDSNRTLFELIDEFFAGRRELAVRRDA